MKEIILQKSNFRCRENIYICRPLRRLRRLAVEYVKNYVSTIYIIIPHTKVKARLSELIKNAFSCKNGKKRYGYILVGHNSSYFVTDTSTANNKYTENDIVRMFDFFDLQFVVECGGVIFQPVIGIPMGTIRRSVFIFL